MSALACIGTPISWPRLETFASGRADATISEHVAACPACRHCLDEIRADVVALPPLAVPAPTPRRAWWAWAVPALALAAAAVIALVVFRGDDPRPREENVVAIKGVGDVVLETVRERSGTIRENVRSFATGDRWKLVVTCPPSAGGVMLAVDVTVVEIGGAPQIDRPLVPSRIACGNRVVLPGAFSLTGPRANRVCAAIGPDRDTACVTIAPE
ncbi:MAG: hypothetical protein AB7T06_08655 [Kofleriaceae bacterium]